MAFEANELTEVPAMPLILVSRSWSLVAAAASAAASAAARSKGSAGRRASSRASSVAALTTTRCGGLRAELIAELEPAVVEKPLKLDDVEADSWSPATLTSRTGDDVEVLADSGERRVVCVGGVGQRGEQHVDELGRVLLDEDEQHLEELRRQHALRHRAVAADAGR